METSVAANEATALEVVAGESSLRVQSRGVLPMLPHVLVWTALTILFTSMVVHYSLTRGKLIVPAHYDDVTYLRDGLDKLDGFYRGGLSGLLSRTLIRPPHSPFSTFLAFVGDAIFGVHDWSPYAANGIIIFGLLAFVDYLTRGLRPWHKAVAFGFVLTVPIAAQCVYEFRSDMAVGLLTTAIIVLLIEKPLVRSRLQYRTLIGCLLGITLLSKTSVFPITLSLAGAALVASTVRDRLLFGKEASIHALAKAWATILIPAVLIPLPFYVRNRGEIYAYITVNALGENSDIWKLHASRLTHLLYYATGVGGRVMLGRHFALLAVVLLAAVAYVLARGRRAERARAACYAFMLLVTYAGPTVNPIKDPFLAVTFDFLAIAASLLALREFLSDASPFIVRALAGGFFVFMLVAGAWWAKLPMYWGEVTRADVVTRNGYVHGLYGAIRSHDPTGDGQVLVGVTGVFVNADGLAYLADKDGLNSIRFVSDFVNKDFAAFENRLNQSRFVVTGDPQNPEDDPSTPYTAMLDRTLAMIRSRRDFRLIGTFPAGGGKNYYVYERTAGAP